jgi:hypothetical protein
MQNKNISPFKTEPSSSRSMPGSFRDVTALDSDSDVEIIPASEYHDNGRHIRTPTNNNQNMRASIYGTQQSKAERPKFSPEAQIAGDAALHRLGQSASNDALQRAMYGKQQLPRNWMNSAGPVPGPTPNSLGPGLHPLAGPRRPTGSYVYPNVYSNGLGDMNTMPGLYSGSMQINGMGGMNSMPGAYPRSMQSNVPRLGYAVNNGSYAPPFFGLSQAGPSQAFGDSSQSSSSDELGDLIRRAGNNYNDISDYLKLDGSMNNQLDYIMNDPRKTSQEIKELLENIRPDVDLPPEHREGTPEGLVYPLVSLELLA